MFSEALASASEVTAPPASWMRLEEAVPPSVPTNLAVQPRL